MQYDIKDGIQTNLVCDKKIYITKEEVLGITINN